MVPAPNVLGESTLDRISLDGLLLRKSELEQRDSRGYRKFCRHFRIPYEFLELVQLTKAPKGVLIGCKGPVVLKDKVVANSAKNALCLVWVRDGSKPRQKTVLYYSRL